MGAGESDPSENNTLRSNGSAERGPNTCEIKVPLGHVFESIWRVFPAGYSIPHPLGVGPGRRKGSVYQ